MTTTACDAKGDTVDPMTNPETIALASFTGTPGSACTANSGMEVSYSGYTLSSYRSVGYDGSAHPGAGANNVRTMRTTGECTGSTSTRSAGSSSYGDWEVNGGATTYLNCYSQSSGGCGQEDSASCSGTYQVEITQPPAEVTKCDDFDKVKIMNELKNISADRVVEEDHACAAGSGSFTLFPLGMHDRDGDGSATVMMLPVMTEGTGTMTMNAWVTSLTVVDDEGYDLRIVDPGFDLVQGSDDLVAGLSSHSTLVTGTHSFSSGEHSGFAPFVIEELDPPDIEDLAVDMTWTCSSGAATVSRDQGYILDLDDLGCGVDQKLVMRVLNGPNRIHWELYGTAHVTKVTPTVNGAGGRDFSLAIGPLLVAGTVTSWDSTDAEVTFTTIEYDGVDVCDEGSYTLPAE
ncbi:hypothetical protein L6R53_21135 [Myxococcota bacterium]|nr:hypothetical protein [Myxococcota bacterium]